jgi:hypothetical protein
MKRTEINMDCKTFQNELPDLVLEKNARPSAAAVAHLRSCPPCAEEYLSFQSTFAALDAWHAPEPSPYFDQKLAVQIREEQAAPKMGWVERLRTSLQLNTGRNFRPAMVAMLALTLVVGGGGIAGINGLNHPAMPAASATVNDLEILDRNEQAFQELDDLQQDDNQPPDVNDLNDDATSAQPTS